jgi:large subunit ribosomal protein L33
VGLSAADVVALRHESRLYRLRGLRLQSSAAIQTPATDCLASWICLVILQVPRHGGAVTELKAMAKAKKKAETVFLVCEETGDYNYIVRRKPGGEKLKLKKYSPRVRKHTMHLEKKK